MYFETVNRIITNHDDSRLKTFYQPIKSLLLWMKCRLINQHLQMFGLKLNKCE